MLVPDKQAHLEDHDVRDGTIIGVRGCSLAPLQLACNATAEQCMLSPAAGSACRWLVVGCTLRACTTARNACRP